MLQYPEDNLSLYDAYGVDYVMVSAYEETNFAVDEEAIRALFPCVFDQDGIRLYEVNR